MPLIPKQKIPTSQKNKDWGKKCIQAYIAESSFSSTDKAGLVDLYEAYNGLLDEGAYNYVTNPYNSEAWKKKNFPAKLRNYNIIKPVVDLLMGEKSKRPASYQVVVRNADLHSKKTEAIYEAVIGSLQQMFVNELNAQGVDTGMESKPVEDPKHIADFLNTNYKDARAITGQQSLDYLRDYLDLDDQFQKAFFDWLITGQVYSYKGVCMDEVEFEIVSPLDIDYQKSPDIDFIEDGDWVVRRKYMTVNAILDSFYDVLSDDEIDALEKPSGRRSGGGYLEAALTPDTDEGDNDRYAEVIHVTWKSFRKVGILTYTDEFGFQQEIEIDEQYKVDREAGERVQWFWVNHVWEGYRIDGSIFVGIQPHEVQRPSMTNMSICKLPYNGRAYSNRHVENTSIVQMGLPYQILYNVFHYRLELTMAKNKDKIALIEMNTIPKRHGWDEEKFMYYADAMGFAFIDSTAEGKNNERVTFNQYQVLDMSLSQYISAQFQLLQAIKQEWEDLVGITRQRKGQVMASDGSGATERAVFQSSVMTEELFRKFDKYEEKEMQGLLDCSKHAWRGGKKSAYITSDYRNELLEIEGEEYAEAEYAVFAKNSSKENTKLETFKSLALSFAQNGSKPSTVAEILDTDNFSNIKRLVTKAEEAEAQMKQQEQQMQQQMQQQQLEAQQQMQDERMIFEATQKDADRQNKLDVEAMKIAGRQADQDLNNNGIPDYMDIQRVEMERERIASNEKIQNRKLDIEEEKMRKKD